jgi:hypothetical protein
MNKVLPRELNKFIMEKLQGYLNWSSNNQKYPLTKKGLNINPLAPKNARNEEDTSTIIPDIGEIPTWLSLRKE